MQHFSGNIEPKNLTCVNKGSFWKSLEAEGIDGKAIHPLSP